MIIGVAEIKSKGNKKADPIGSASVTGIGDWSFSL
jgi:hypothetical protein